MEATTVNPPNGRGCGDRKKGGVYACIGVGAGGSPIEMFVVDPCRPWPDNSFRRGAKLMPRNPADPQGVKDLIVYVGEKFYRSPWTFVEEARHFGISRRMPQNLPFEQLTPGVSRMIFMHAKAIPQFEYQVNRNKPYKPWCSWSMSQAAQDGTWPPVDWGTHPDDQYTRCTFALRDLAWLVEEPDSLMTTAEETTLLAPEEREGEEIAVTRTVPVTDFEGKPAFKVVYPSFEYIGTYPKLPDVAQGRPELDWQAGIFLAVPLTHFETKGEAGDWKEKANRAGYEVAELDW